MNLKKLILLFPLIIIVSCSFQMTNVYSSSNSEDGVAWGHPSHYKIVDTAIATLPDEWEALFTYFRPEVIGGSIEPDAWQDFINHLYYPTEAEGGGYTAPQACQKWFGYVVGNLSNGNYETAAHSAGILSHYASDICQAVHTYNYWDGHSALETSINNHISEFTFGTFDPIDTLTQDTVDEAVIAWATTSHAYYNLYHTKYPDSTVNDKCVTDSELKKAIESQLTNSVTNVLSLWLSAFKQSGYIAPVVIQETSDIKVWIDGGHSNDYVTANGVASFKSYLSTLGCQVIQDSNGISANELDDVSIVIITALYSGTPYTATELNYLTQWAATTKEKAVFVTGRGDFAPIDYASINAVLDALGSETRMNSDNVYSAGSVYDPNYYKDWYVYTRNFVMPDSLPLPAGEGWFHQFSPSSLYFTESFSGQVLINASTYHYQTDQNTPAPVVVWDNVKDNSNGDHIPLTACEDNSTTNTKYFISGDTSFSDFSFKPSQYHDNYEYMQAIVENWLDFNYTLTKFGPNAKLSYLVEQNATDAKLKFEASLTTTAVEIYVNNTLITNVTSLSAGFNDVAIPNINGSVAYTFIAYGNGYIRNYTFIADINDYKDSVGPTITSINHSPAEPKIGEIVSIVAQITDDSDIYSAEVHYRKSDGVWLSTLMTLNATLAANTYSAEIGPFDTKGEVEYYIVAFDNSLFRNKEINNNTDSYYSFTVSELPSSSFYVRPTPFEVTLVELVIIGAVLTFLKRGKRQNKMN